MREVGDAVGAHRAPGRTVDWFRSTDELDDASFDERGRVLYVSRLPLAVFRAAVSAQATPVDKPFAILPI